MEIGCLLDRLLIGIRAIANAYEQHSIAWTRDLELSRSVGSLETIKADSCYPRRILLH